jgi:hypothetical protein
VEDHAGDASGAMVPCSAINIEVLNLNGIVTKCTCVDDRAGEALAGIISCPAASTEGLNFNGNVMKITCA